MKLIISLAFLFVALSMTVAVAAHLAVVLSEKPIAVSADDCIEQRAFGVLNQPTQSQLEDFCASYADLSLQGG